VEKTSPMTMTLTPFLGGRAQAPEPVGPGLRERLAEPQALVWIDVTEPRDEELAVLEAELHLPPLAVEDAREARQRPKIDEYEDCVLLVAYGAHLGDDASDRRLTLHEVAMFVGRQYIVTVRQEPALSGDDLRHRLSGTAGRPMPSSTALAHAVLDRIVDGYYAVTEQVQTRIEDVDAKVWDGIAQSDLTEAFALRRDLVRFRRVVAPLREVLNVMVRREGGVLDDSVDEHLRDLYDHVVTVHEEIEMSRELLAGALEGHLSLVSNRMNEVVLKVSAWAAIIAVPTVIASVYGMNFVHMPELHWALGYPAAVALMLAAALALYITFKRRGWL